jgi:asparagine synthase (glutamine-hydrolysing)
VERFDGMFAYAIWDRAEGSLFAARDRFGEKPLFYRHAPGREFRFASEIQALVPPGSGLGRPREEVLFRFLAYGHAGTTDATFLEGIEQVPPAHAITLRGGRLERRRWWSLPEEPEPFRGGEAEAAERLRALLEDAVRLRLRSDVPVGTSLSGGLDSSAVACSVARLAAGGGARGPARRAAFSSVFPGHAVDEGRWVDEVAGAAGLESHRTTPTPGGLLDDLPRLTVAQGEPAGGPSVHAQWCVMRLARERGVTVLLDGQGADEVFGGYHFLFGDAWWPLLRGGRLGALRAEMKAYDALHGAGGARRILGAAARSRRPRWASALKGGPSLPWLAPDFARRAARPLPPRPQDLRGSLRECLATRMLPHLLRHADRSSMAFSREVRLPFLDHRIVAFADALPDGMRMGGGTTKRVLREAIRGLVPEAVRTRRDKVGFAVPEEEWIGGPLAPAFREVFRSARFRERGILEPARVEAALDGAAAGDGAEAGIAWRAFAAEAWLRAFADGPGGRG